MNKYCNYNDVTKTIKNLLIFDSHPVQYRVPIWKELEIIFPEKICVVYGSDCSVRGYSDEGFSKSFAWDEPMLEGYNNIILNCEKGKPLATWGSLTGKGIKELIKKTNPNVILLTGLNYKYDLIAYLYARIYRIPIWLRCETQDKSFKRTLFKSLIRSLVYRFMYSGFDKFFYIGELNKQHYLNHGVKPKNLLPARYGTTDRFNSLSISDKVGIRSKIRLDAGISSSNLVVGFSGKFIAKKNPELLFQMLDYLPKELLSKICLYFIGSGDMESILKDMAYEAFIKYGVKSFFTGFVNQSHIAPHYLAMDILVLPSRRMGETWGLVCNEAMQAGCGVIVSNAVGSSVDFKNWERFEVIEEENAIQLSIAITNLSGLARNFEWAKEKLKAYSINSTVNAFAKELIKLKIPEKVS
jgi:glycosyltransferase involved in cell wall biosynthesis